MIKLRYLLPVLGIIFELIHRTYPLCWIILISFAIMVWWDRKGIDRKLLNLFDKETKKELFVKHIVGRLYWSNSCCRSDYIKLKGGTYKHLWGMLFWKR